MIKRILVLDLIDLMTPGSVFVKITNVDLHELSAEYKLYELELDSQRFAQYAGIDPVAKGILNKLLDDQNITLVLTGEIVKEFLEPNLEFGSGAHVWRLRIFLEGLGIVLPAEVIPLESAITADQTELSQWAYDQIVEGEEVRVGKFKASDFYELSKALFE
jgi:hypothetical protein